MCNFGLLPAPSPVQMCPSLPNPPSTPPPDFATAHPPPAAYAILIMPQLHQHATSSGPSAVQMTSQRHHAHIIHTVTAVLPLNYSHVAQAPVPQRRGHKRRALSTAAASQITRRVRQRSDLSHATSHVGHQPGYCQQCLRQLRALFAACLLMLHPAWLEDPLRWGPHLIEVARENMHCLFGGGRG